MPTCRAPIDDEGTICPNPPGPDGFCGDHTDEDLGDPNAKLCGAKIIPPCGEEVHANYLCEGHLKRQERGLEVHVPLRKYKKKGLSLATHTAENVLVATRISRKADQLLKQKAREGRSTKSKILKKLVESALLGAA